MHLGGVGAGAPSVPAGPLSVRFDHVTFGYDEARDVLDHFDVTIPPGRIVAIVGATGSGKSTFLAMLDRLLVPDEGTISLGGVELSKLPDAQLRRAVSLVFQEPFLFAGSVLDNIDLGAGIDHEAIATRRPRSRRSTSSSTTCRTVGRHVIGERGVTLSGGPAPAGRARSGAGPPSRSSSSSTTPRRASTRRPRRRILTGPLEPALRDA